MNRFFVGQRVRIVAAIEASEVVGREATIASSLQPAMSIHDGRFIRWEGYDVDVAGVGRFDADGRKYCFRPEFLEPIQPSGHRPSEYTFTELMDRCRAGEVANV